MFVNFAAEKAFPTLLPALLACLFWFFPAPQLHAADRPLFTGEFQHISGVTTNAPHDYYPAVQRLTLSFEERFSDGQFHVSGNIRNYFASSPDSLDLFIPELWVEFWFSRGDLRFGRQDFRWGLTPVNSLFEFLRPRDLRNFVIEPDRAAVRGNIAISYRYYAGSSTFEMVFSPVLTPNILPDPGKRWFIDVPAPAGLPLRISGNHDNQNSFNGQPPELQAGLMWQIDVSPSLEIQLSAFQWVPPMPTFEKQFLFTETADPVPSPAISLEPSYQPSIVLGGGSSYQTRSGFILTAEAMWYHRKQFDRIPTILLGFDPADTSLQELARIAQVIENEKDGFISVHQAFQSLAELRYTRGLLTTGIQWFWERVLSPQPDIVQKERFHRISGFVSRDIFRQRLSSSLLVTFHPAGDDYWVNTEHQYDFTDNVNLGIGAHFFGGPSPDESYGHLSFGSYKKNSLLYGSLSFFW